MSAESQLAQLLNELADQHPVPHGLWADIDRGLDRHSKQRSRALAVVAVLVVVAVAALAAGGAAMARRDRGASPGHSPTTTDPKSTGADRSELPRSLLALRDDGQLALVDSLTFSSTTLVAGCRDCTDIQLAGDRVLFQRGEELFAIPRSGGTPAPVARGCGVAVSIDGRQAAWFDCRTGSIGVRSLHSGGPTRTWPAPSLPPVALAWDAAGSSLLISAGEPAAIYRLDTTDAGASPKRLGPGPDGEPDGTGWISPDVRSDGVIAVAQVCCAVGAGQYPGPSAIVYLAPGDGHPLVRSPIEAQLVKIDLDASGRFVLLTAADGDVFAEWRGHRLRLGGGIRRASW